MTSDFPNDLTPVDLSLQLNLMNVGGSVSLREVLDLLKERLPIRAVYSRSLPQPGVPMAHGGGDWLVILDAGASIAAIGAALVAAYDRFIKPLAGQRKVGKAGLLAEFRNSAGDFSLWKVDAENRDVALNHLSESIRVVEKRDSEGNESIEASVERSQTWVKVDDSRS